MTRNPPAYRRAVAAFSPAGTRNTSAPADRLDAPVQLDLARRGHPASAGDVVPELLVDLEREGKARGRAADVAEVDVHLQRQLDLGVLRDAYADDRPLRVVRRGDRRNGARDDFVV